MRRVLVLFILGLLCAALFSAAISVYLFHDVDKSQVGRWNQAFVGLCFECLVFTLILGGGVAFLTLLSRRLLHLTGYGPNAKMGLYLGIGVAVLQYPWDIVARKTVPKLGDAALALYLVASIVICTAIIVHGAKPYRARAHTR